MNINDRYSKLDNNIDYDNLYKLAFRYRETKLWQKISAYMPLALCLEGGDIAYINVIGQMGEYYAINVSLNDEGYYFLEKLFKNETWTNDFVKFANIFEGDFIQLGLGKKSYLYEEELERVTAYKVKNNLRLKGPHTFPFFRKSREFAQAVELKDKNELDILRQVIEALISLDEILKDKSKKDLGIGYYFENDNIPLMRNENGSYVLNDYIDKPQNVRVSYPQAKILNIDTIKKLKEIPKNISFNIKLLPIYNIDIYQGKLFQVLVLLPFVEGMEMMLTLDLSDSPDAYPDKIVNDFLEVLIEEEVNPAVLNAFDKRTYDLFKNICPILDIGLKLIDEDDQLRNFEDSINTKSMATYLDDDDYVDYLMSIVLEAMAKIQMPEDSERTYEEILADVEFMIYYSSFPYVESDESLTLSLKEAIRDLKKLI